MIEYLPQLVPEPGPRVDQAGPDHPMRQVTRQVAFEPGGWDQARSDRVRRLFDDLAGEWHTRASEPRQAPLTDAFERGGPVPPGRWVEIGSGTGLVTPWLAARTDTVVAVDLAFEMIRRGPASAGPRVRADAAALPLPAGSVDALVLVNAFLFPREADRVVGTEGVIVWVNTAGPGTPIYLPADEVVRAMGAGWEGRASQAAFGTWVVVRRAGTGRGS